MAEHEIDLTCFYFLTLQIFVTSPQGLQSALSKKSSVLSRFIESLGILEYHYHYIWTNIHIKICILTHEYQQTIQLSITKDTLFGSYPSKYEGNNEHFFWYLSNMSLKVCGSRSNKINTT